MTVPVRPFEVIIPWGKQTCIERGILLPSVLKGLDKLFCTVRLSGATPWSPGRARNKGAADCKADVIVFNDADTIVPVEQIRQAAKAAQDAPGLVFAYDLYLRVAKDGTVADGPYEQEIMGSGSMGCVAIRRDCFNAAGGFDEGYLGWGYEDLDFANRCDKLWPNRRIPGPAYHLWHGDRRRDDSPTDSDPERVAENLKRWTLTF